MLKQKLLHNYYVIEYLDDAMEWNGWDAHEYDTFAEAAEEAHNVQQTLYSTDLFVKAFRVTRNTVTIHTEVIKVIPVEQE